MSSMFATTSKGRTLGVLGRRDPRVVIASVRVARVAKLRLVGTTERSMPRLHIVILANFSGFRCTERDLQLRIRSFFLGPVSRSSLFGTVRGRVGRLGRRRGGRRGRTEI